MVKVGFKHSEETKQKMSEAKLKNPTRYWLGKKMPPVSKETRQKLRDACLRNGNKPPVNYGADNNKWKGGITPENVKIRHSLEYKEWRVSVFKRDNYTCLDCGQIGGTLNADHVKPFSLFPDSRFDINNGRTLCHPCHTKTDTYGHKIHSYVSKEKEICQ